MNTVCINDFGILPDSFSEAGEAFSKAIESVCGKNALLTLKTGEYHFYCENAIKRNYHISNTATPREAPDTTKHIGILFEQCENLTIDFGGSTLIFHGKFTQIVFDKSKNITVKNLKTDFSRPTMTELTLLEICDGYCDFSVNPDCDYLISDGKVTWVGRDFSFVSGPTQILSRKKGITWRCGELTYKKAEKIGDRLRLYDANISNAEPDDVFQIRDGIRDEVGMFAVNSSDITMKNVTAYYLHGLGFVGQFSENLTFDDFSTIPNKEKNRTNSCFADSIHISGCKGLVSVKNCVFDGAHDDALNIHGTHLQITGILNENSVKVAFRHLQTHGFEAFFEGDEIEFVDENSLLATDKNTIKKAELISDFEMILETMSPLPKSLRKGNVIENVTWQPQVIFENNQIYNVPTRGILLSSRKKTVVKNNLFYKTPMAAILIADDARSWYESGHVYDMEITDNKFIDCSSPVINILPESTTDDSNQKVHKNIRIKNNDFGNADVQILAKSVDGLEIDGNIYSGKDFCVKTHNCLNVIINNNTKER